MVRYLGCLLTASTAFWLGTMGLTVRHVPNLDTELHSWLDPPPVGLPVPTDALPGSLPLHSVPASDGQGGEVDGSRIAVHDDSNTTLQQQSSLDTELRKAAQDFFHAYLAAWSSENAAAPDLIAHFYGSQVRFYGNDISMRSLTDEKRRFVRRWPIRQYRARQGSVSAQCDSDTETCTVASLLDYAALNPARGRRASGTSDLELEISFATGRPEILKEGRRTVGVTLTSSLTLSSRKLVGRVTDARPPAPPSRSDPGS